MRDLSPAEIASLVAAAMALVVWIGALRGARSWRRFQLGRRKPGETSAPPSDGPDDPDRPRGPWG